MKLFLQTIMILMVLSVIGSCSDNGNDNYTTPTNLVGTNWKCSMAKAFDENLEYIILKYTSANGVEYWTKHKNVEFKRGWIGTYTISSDVIVIKGGDPEKTIPGTVKGVTMNLTLVDGTAPFTFILE